VPDVFNRITDLRKSHPNKLLCAFLNINSFRYKFCHIKEILQKNTIDLLFICETKLDDSFVDSQFLVDNYHFWRKDRTAHGGGVAAYLRSDLAGDRKPNLEFKVIETIGVEVVIENTKWFIA